MARKLALGVVGVAEGGHDQHGLLVEPGAVAGQDLARLAGVGGTRYERERHSARIYARAGTPWVPVVGRRESSDESSDS